MARRSRRIDPDAASGRTPSVKVGDRTTVDVLDARSSARQGLRDLDGMIQGSSGFTQSHKDAQRSYPRETTAPLRPRTHRDLPHPDETRVPISGRQRKARSKAKNQALARTPATERREAERLLTDPEQWRRVNDELSTVTGDVHHDDVSDATRRTCQRVDRMIQRAERYNDRSHVVYTNGMLPEIKPAGLRATAAHEFPVGEHVEFDRYTAAAHTMHEIQPEDRADEERSVVYEISTRRGMYMGHSAGGQSTGHLLPRATRYEIVGTHTATYVGPGGVLNERVVVQLRDIPDHTEAPQEEEA